MKRKDQKPAHPSGSEDKILKFHLQVAQRADELARQTPGTRDRETDRKCWLDAERDVLEMSDW